VQFGSTRATSNLGPALVCRQQPPERCLVGLFSEHAAVAIEADGRQHDPPTNPARLTSRSHPDAGVRTLVRVRPRTCAYDRLVATEERCLVNSLPMSRLSAKQ
jgi:hypothetical protein